MRLDRLAYCQAQASIPSRRIPMARAIVTPALALVQQSIKGGSETRDRS